MCAHTAQLEGIPGISLSVYDESQQCNYQYVTLEVDERHAGLSRDELVTVLQSENILARRYFYPGCHNMEPYKSFFPNAHLVLPETTELARRILVLPTGTAVGEAEVSTICQIIQTATDNATAARNTLSAETK